MALRSIRPNLMLRNRRFFCTSASSCGAPSSLFLHGLISSQRFCSTATPTKQNNDDASSSQLHETPEQLARRLRKGTDREVYEPGVFAKALRSVVVAVTDTFGLRKRVALRMESGLKEIARLEKEQKWLRAHGSPLRVLGLPETADLEDVKVRYRNLLFETHPDTAPKADQQALIALGLSHEKARERQLQEFELLQTAYKMATSPNSLWHQDGNAPLLLREIAPQGNILQRVFTIQNAVPVVAYIYGFAVAFFIFGVVAYLLMERILNIIDPDFFSFMLAQEAEDKRKREAGEVVDTDPKRLAPDRMLQISAPGRFVNSADVPDEDQFNDKPPAAAA